MYTCRCLYISNFNRMVTRYNSISSYPSTSATDKRSISYRAGDRDPNTVFTLNHRTPKGYHNQIVGAKCQDSLCNENICQQLCSQLDYENSLAHLTHNPNTPISEFNDKYPMWLDSIDFKGRNLDQFAMMYNNPPKTAPTEVTTDTNVTNYISQSHIVEAVHNEVKDKMK